VPDNWEVVFLRNVPPGPYQVSPCPPRPVAAGASPVPPTLGRLRRSKMGSHLAVRAPNKANWRRLWPENADPPRRTNPNKPNSPRPNPMRSGSAAGPSTRPDRPAEMPAPRRLAAPNKPNSLTTRINLKSLSESVYGRHAESPDQKTNPVKPNFSLASRKPGPFRVSGSPRTSCRRAYRRGVRICRRKCPPDAGLWPPAPG